MGSGADNDTCGAVGPEALSNSPRSSIFTSGRRVNCGRVGTSFSPKCDAARGREGMGVVMLPNRLAPQPLLGGMGDPGRMGDPLAGHAAPHLPAAPRPDTGLLTGGAAHKHLHLQTGPAVVVCWRGCKARAGWDGSAAGDPSPWHPEARWVRARWGLALPGGALQTGGMQQYPHPAL